MFDSQAGIGTFVKMTSLFYYDVRRDSWVLPSEDGQHRIFSVQGFLAVQQAMGTNPAIDAIRRHLDLQVELENTFPNEPVLAMILAAIGLFAPGHFLNEPELLTHILCAQARYLQFLKQWIRRILAARARVAARERRAASALLGTLAPPAERSPSPPATDFALSLLDEPRVDELLRLCIAAVNEITQLGGAELNNITSLLLLEQFTPLIVEMVESIVPTAAKK